MRHFRISLAASLSILALAVGGCGGNDSESTDSPPTQTGGSAGTGGAAGAGTGGAAGQAGKGGSSGSAGQAGEGGSAGNGAGGAAGASGSAGAGGAAGASGSAGAGGVAGAAGTAGNGGSAPIDQDKDGADSTVDCDDNDPAVNPSALEVCDGKDNNCDKQIDEGVSKTKYYPDGDKDGYGTDTGMVEACASPGEYYATQAGDCDDGNPAVNSSAPEICDLVDNDCDSLVDEGVTTTWYVDGDADGYGVDAAGTNKEACSQPTGYAAVAGDCDDTKPVVNPGATELCDELDNDCDTQVDEGVTKNTYYPDGDKDGYGANAGAVQGCTAPPGDWSLQGGDCDNADPQRFPGNTEVCDGKDNDCNAATSEPGLGTYYLDSDKDGFGNPSKTTKACALPSGYVTNKLDCNDSSPAINPNAIEVCDGVDNNCVGGIDEGPVETWPDVDQDGFGDAKATSTFRCAADSSHVTNSKDCNDADKLINPDGVEIPGNGIDENCDGADTKAGTVCGSDSYAAAKLPYLSINNSLTVSDNTPGNPAGDGYYWDDYEISTVAGQAFTALMNADTPATLRPRMYMNTNSCGPAGFAVNTGWYSVTGGYRRARQIVDPTVSGYYYQVLTSVVAGQTGGYDYEVVPGKLGTSCGTDDAGIWPLGYRETNQLATGDAQTDSPVPAGYLADDYEFFLRANQTYTLLYGGMTWPERLYLSQAGACATSLGTSTTGILNAGARYVYVPATDGIYIAWLTTTSNTASGAYTFNVVPGNVGESCFAGAGETTGTGDSYVIYPLGGTVTESLAIGDRVDPFLGTRFHDDFETWLEKGQSVTITMTTPSGGFVPHLRLTSAVACSTALVMSPQSTGNTASITYTAPSAGIYVILATSFTTNQTGNFTLATQIN